MSIAIYRVARAASRQDGGGGGGDASMEMTMRLGTVVSLAGYLGQLKRVAMLVPPPALSVTLGP